MQIRGRQVLCGLTASLAALALLPACGVVARDSGNPSTSRTTTMAVAAPRPTQAPQVAKWIDLQVGDCLADVPPSDPSVVTVALVDCATTHRAEVYLRSAVGVDQAVAGVADSVCDLGFAQYTGRPVGGSPFTVTYLIDSDQDRTSSNPAPSTVICLLQAANGRPLTQSARR